MIINNPDQGLEDMESTEYNGILFEIEEGKAGLKLNES